MNISMGATVKTKTWSERERVVNNLIDNIATSLPNKGNFRLIKKFRTISLIWHPCIMVRVMLNRIKERLAEPVSEEQI